MARLKSNLTAIALQAPHAAKAALLQTGKDILQTAKELVPVDTGALKQSGGVNVQSSTVIEVGFGSPGTFRSTPKREPEVYAPFVEYGTSKMAAQPYLTPAFAQNESTFRKRLEDAIKGII